MINVTQKIPKIIHYCWFGGKPLPYDLQECVNSWNKLDGYTIMRWDESNCSFNENPFIIKAYSEKKYAFISDYYRLKALYEYGGIYLDTDVMVYKSFDDLLIHPAFFNFIFDCSVGSAIIGAQKQSPLIKSFLEMYDKTVITDKDTPKRLEWRDDKLISRGYNTNNYYFTYYILHNYPNFVLNNKYQDLGDFVIYPKELFEIGTLTNRHYAIHLCAGEWRIKADTSKTLKGKIKTALQKNSFIFDKLQIIIRKRRYKKLNKSIPFYAYSIAQKKHEKLPEL